jgi:hypothetical protein
MDTRSLYLTRFLDAYKGKLLTRREGADAKAVLSKWEEGIVTETLLLDCRMKKQSVRRRHGCYRRPGRRVGSVSSLLSLGFSTAAKYMPAPQTKMAQYGFTNRVLKQEAFSE